MPRASNPPGFHLHIDAHALLQLGEQLISDDAQALLELVKNSYDADAEWARITLRSDYVPTAVDPAPADAVGLIEIEDNGVGMDLNAIQNSWLRISFSFKRAQKRDHIKSKRFGRLPIGDKGLGRLGTMRLGSHLSVESRSAPDRPGWIVTFQWSDVQSGKPLESVPIQATEVPANGKVGTTVRIFGLRNVSEWKSRKRIADLRLRLCGLISPFGVFRDFDVVLEANGTEYDLERITESLRDSATVRFDYSWDGTALTICGKIKIAWFQKNPEGYQRWIASDEGNAFFSFLNSQTKLGKSIGLERMVKSGWFVTISKTIPQSDLAFNDHHARDPGSFDGSLDFFDLGGVATLPDNLFDRRSDYQSLVKELAQIYIYRDGFGIGMNRDWLNLGGAWTAASGYYSLKPNNVIGYFAISVEHNPNLVEKSDREGFVENSEWRGFKFLADQVKGFANNALNNLGRASVRYLKECSGEHASEESSQRNYGDLLRRLTEILVASETFERRFNGAAETRRNAIRQIGGAARLLWVDIKEPKERREKAKKILDSAERLVPELEEDHSKLRELLDSLQQQKELAGIIRRRIDEYEDRAQLMYEMVAVGLSAQAMAHDVPELLGRIGDNARAIVELAKTRIASADKVRKHATEIVDGCEGVAEMVNLVTPMLRGRRKIRQRGSLVTFVENYYSLRGARLRTHGIHWHIETNGMRDFQIAYNPGRFIQILDNLTNNSEYWIRQRFGNSKKGVISIHIDDPEVRLWDNGPGIRPDLEDCLFDLFTSGKPEEEGNGLGLFITRQILLRDNCTISLDPQRNADGRLFRFAINFSGVKI